MNLREVKEAIELLSNAVAINPFLTGAYKDLGDLYSGQYQFERAWRCWTAARHISPSHPMLEEAGRREEMLLGEHPEYF